ncbi:MAG: hypothetical protein SVR08_10415 [Spirochaetota bacterium]|nr:hypothetical protein [Spirochaetota bacterium]
MDLLLLIVVNIVLATIFYLIMRLRLERSVHTYQEKKLLKIMDEVIREFDSTAERNITILENRISIMKKLLIEAGRIKPIDLNINEFDELSGFVDSTATIDKNALEEGTVDFNSNIMRSIDFDSMNDDAILNENSGKAQFQHNTNRIIKKNMTNYFLRLKESVKFNHKSNIKKQDIPDSSHHSDFIDDNVNDSLKELNENNEDITSPSDSDIVVNQANGSFDQAKILYTELANNSNLSEEDIFKLFIASTDKYSLINDLYDDGYTIDIISRCSGIPVVEVKLVLDLNETI